jgi:hypothetical protein
MLKQNRLQMNSYYKSTKINFMKQNLLKLTACISLLVIANTIHAQTWSLTGNTGTSDGTNFIGTTDNVPLNFRVNNQKAGRIDATMQNAFYGLQAGGSNTTGNYNTSIGNYSLFSNTTGIYNMANGFSALFSNTTGSFNMANGAQALRHNTTGSFNMAIGYASLYYNTTGSYNISSGYTALFNNTTGVFNMGNGYAALYANTSGSYNTADGSYALRFNTIGGYNTASGYAALYNTTTGSNNLANGYNALYSNTTGNQSTAIGYQSLFNSTGSNHTAIGYNSLYSNTTGTSNTAIGLNALYTNTTGSNNTSLGYGADVAIGGLTNATAIGSGAIVNASNTIQLGNASITKVLAGTGNNAALVAGGLQITGGTIAAGNVLTSDASGVATWQNPASSGWSLTGNSGTADGTNFIGTTDYEPLTFRVDNIQSGRIDLFENTFYGWGSGVSVTPSFGNEMINGGDNTANGFLALSSNTTGFQNNAIGTYALYSNTTGWTNLAVGGRALYRNTTGNYNTANGSSALQDNTTGGSNTANGFFALSYNQTGSDLTAIGVSADVNSDGYANSTALGAEATITSSNQIRIGSLGSTYGTDPVSIGGKVGWTTLSDGRVKKNIKQNVPGLVFINKLQPITYNLDIDAADRIIQRPQIIDKDGKTVQPLPKDINALKAQEAIIHTGFIAQDVEKAAKSINYDFSGVDPAKNDKDLYGLRYAEFVVPLVKAVQELSTSNDSLHDLVNNLVNLNSDLENRLNQLEIKLESLVKGGVSSGGSNILSSAKLEQNIPNPFNQTTLINYYVPETAGHAFIKVTGINGNAIKTIQLNGAGSGQITLQTATLASGNYTYSLYVDGNLIDTKVMVLAR